jgi:ribose/xylose/arabinose/galactoside ABC-type transport system permease subunit
LTGILIGFLNGFFITTLKLPPFIVTLGIANIARGFTYIVTKGFPIATENQFVLDLGNGYIGPIPVMTMVMIAVVIAAAYLLRKNTFGLRVLAIGGNETATVLSGINVKKYKVIVYSIAGLLCGIAGIIMAGRLNSGNPNAGLGTDMDTIAAAIVGGTSLSGGEGTIVGTLFGALLLGVIKNSLVLLNVNMYWQTVVVGVVIIAVCALDHFAQSKRSN